MKLHVPVAAAAGFLALAPPALISCGQGAGRTTTILAGHVYDRASRQGIPGIDVTCDRGYPTSSLSDGFYAVGEDEDNLPADGDVITCQFTDVDGDANGRYLSAEASTTYPAGSTAVLDVELDPY